MDRMSDATAFLRQHSKWIAVAAAGFVFLAMILLARGMTGKDMALLYAGLDSAAAGEVITSLDAQGANYEVRGTAIFVEAATRDALRMRLAGEGLPANTTQGYELLDSLNGFGTTSQMFDAAYWRAKEGELARTILSSPNIRAARVHISAGGSRPFARDQNVSAAVTVSTNAAGLPNSQISALRFLVAAAVTGLTPDNVSIIDSAQGLLSENANTSQDIDSGSDDLKHRVERILEARVGYGNAVVEVSVERVTQSESILERSVDPSSRVAISSDVSETISSAQDANAAVGVASNLPTGDASTGGSSNENNETRTLTNYEISETTREVVIGPGAVRRLTVAVLVNDSVTEPRSQAELDDLTELVASAVGLDPERGDVLTLRALPFDVTGELGSPAAAIASTPLDVMRLIQTAAFALVALVLGLFVVRPILSNRNTPLPELAAPAEIAAPEPITIEATALDVEQEQRPADRLKQMIGDRRQESLAVLKTWIDESEKGNA